MIFHCIDEKPRSGIKCRPDFPGIYLGRSKAIEILRLRIKEEHRNDLTPMDKNTHQKLQKLFHSTFGSGLDLTSRDPLCFPNWVVYFKIPQYFGFYSILDLLHSDFLVVECLALVKSSLSIENLKTDLENLGQDFPSNAVETIDFSIDTAMFHLVNSVFRLRSCFDKLVISIGYSLQIGPKIRKKKTYSKKISTLKSSNQAKFILEGQDCIFKELIKCIEDIGDLQHLRDCEAHLSNVSVKMGMFDKISNKELPDLIEMTLDYLEKFRIALLLFIAFLPTLVEGGSFPEESTVLAYNFGVVILDSATSNKFMTFIVDEQNAVDREPKEINMFNGVLNVKYGDGSFVKIDFLRDEIIKEKNGIRANYRGTISDRNSGKGFYS